MRVERVERAVVSLVRYKNKTPSLSFFLAAIKSNVRGESASQVLYLPAALSFGDPVFSLPAHHLPVLSHPQFLE